jgi:hypothetical protein
MGSITDPTGEKPTSTGNGIAVYKFAAGQVTPERFIKIAPQPIAEGKEVAFGVRKTPAGTALPYPAGFAVLPGPKGDRLLIANNLSDNAVVLDTSWQDPAVVRLEPQPFHSKRLSLHGDRKQSRNQSVGEPVEHRSRRGIGPGEGNHRALD